MRWFRRDSGQECARIGFFVSGTYPEGNWIRLDDVRGPVNEAHWMVIWANNQMVLWAYNILMGLNWISACTFLRLCPSRLADKAHSFGFGPARVEAGSSRNFWRFYKHKARRGGEGGGEERSSPGSSLSWALWWNSSGPSPDSCFSPQPALLPSMLMLLIPYRFLRISISVAQVVAVSRLWSTPPSAPLALSRWSPSSSSTPLLCPFPRCLCSVCREDLRSRAAGCCHPCGLQILSSWAATGLRRVSTWIIRGHYSAIWILLLLLFTHLMPRKFLDIWKGNVCPRRLLMDHFFVFSSYCFKIYVNIVCYCC